MLQCECKRSAWASANTPEFLLHIGTGLVWMWGFSVLYPHTSPQLLSTAVTRLVIIIIVTAVHCQAPMSNGPHINPLDPQTREL